MIPKTNWEDNFKVKIRNFSESTDKHDIIKLLIMRMLVRKHKGEKQWMRIYAEHPVRCNKEVRVADIIYQNIKTKEAYAFEIQKDHTIKWLNEVTEFYKNWDKEVSNMFYKTADLITIPTKQLSDNIQELRKQLKEYIV